MKDQLLTPPEVAAILRVKENTLAIWRTKGRYPALSYIKRGKNVFYLASVVEKFLTQDQAI